MNLNFVKYFIQKKRNDFSKLSDPLSVDEENYLNSKSKKSKGQQINMKISKKDNDFPWFQWQGSTCRFDSFVTVIPRINYLNSTNQSEHLNYIREISIKIIEGDLDSNVLIYSYLVSKGFDKSTFGEYGTLRIF